MPLLRGPRPQNPSRFSLQARASPSRVLQEPRVRPHVLLADNTLESPWGFNFHPSFLKICRMPKVHALFPKCGGHSCFFTSH